MGLLPDRRRVAQFSSKLAHGVTQPVSNGQAVPDGERGRLNEALEPLLGRRGCRRQPQASAEAHGQTVSSHASGEPHHGASDCGGDQGH